MELDDERKLHKAITQLLDQQGFRCGSNDIVVKKASTRSGHTRYVVIALKGTEIPVANVIASFAARDASICGVWVLRQQEVLELQRKAETAQPAKPSEGSGQGAVL